MSDFPVKEDIIEIIEDAVAKASPSPPLDFGHGTNAYANIQDQDKKITGDIAWLFPVQLRDDIKDGGVIKTKYTILMAVGVLSNLSNDAVKLEAELKTMSVLTKRIVIILDDDDRIKEITDISREPLYFTRDLAMTGYGLRMTIELEFEDFNYCIV